MTLHDPKVVRAEYATETGLEARRAAYKNATGPHTTKVLFDAIAEVGEGHYLEVGCGPGELAARVQDELAAEVVAVDTSDRMVALARERGVECQLGDVEDLPFVDGRFDCVVAAWMLYHVAHVERALAELARVFRPGGHLIAVTNYSDHLQELRECVGAPRRETSTFSGEDGERLLAKHFSDVRAIDVTGTVTFADRDAILAYVRPSAALFGSEPFVPELDEPLVVRRRPVIFVATK